jgi:hypothetical protein
MTTSIDNSPTLTNKRKLAETSEEQPLKRVKLDAKIAALVRSNSTPPSRNFENSQFDTRKSINKNVSSAISSQLKAADRNFLVFSRGVYSHRDYVSELRLSDCFITAEVIAQLASLLPHTKKLSLVRCHFPAEATEQLPFFPELQEIQFIQTPLPEISALAPPTLQTFRYTLLDEEGKIAPRAPSSEISIQKKPPLRAATPDVNATRGEKSVAVPKKQEASKSLANTEVESPNTIASRAIRNFIKNPTVRAPLLPKEELITALDLSGETLSSSLISKIAHMCPNITELNLEGATITDDAVAKVQAFSQLAKLDLSLTPIEGNTLAKLPPTLTSLSLRECPKLQEKHLANLSKFSLEFLDISGTQIFGVHFSSLPHTLKTLGLASCPLSELAIASFYKFRNLETLDISFTKITGKYFSLLPNNLKTLLIVECNRLEEDAYSELKHHPLKELLEGNSMRTESETVPDVFLRQF